MKVKTIVVGIDGSADARDALDTAIDLVADDGVIHVVAAFHSPTSAEINRVLAALPREFKDTYDPLAEPHSHNQPVNQVANTVSFTCSSDRYVEPSVRYMSYRGPFHVVRRRNSQSDGCGDGSVH